MHNVDAAIHNRPLSNRLEPPPLSAPTPTYNPIVLRRSQRQRLPPTFLKDYHCNLLHISPTLMSSIAHPLDRILSYGFSTNHRHFLLSIYTTFEPQFFHQTIRFDHWKQAMDDEIAAIERTNTWSLIPLPPNHHAIGCK